jgi:hypothetical protein
MSPHETLVHETREWLERARADLAACAALIAAGLPAEALFHAQQCAEKAIKAFLTWHQISFKKTHGLDELKQLCLPLAGDARTWPVSGSSRSTLGASAIPARRILPNEQRRKKPGRPLAGYSMPFPPVSNRSSEIERNPRVKTPRYLPNLRASALKPLLAHHAPLSPL